ncbi:calcineurin-like phosphoesterase [Sporothrix schenckii 1099-18]|uniref:Calcineurin-like phosphoesterase n=1 Tax=Sporothrix schenckii 1099-18 TaxID=1397361 RepID=A0A0F2M7L3_SPOSC|nr:calcineurin-like phosphoesterase [Sporothrix schenckii 1099-18]KJR85627.1 calcineurin-like phosphoesterase [Sporothrix schenckii 1099-18]
MAGYRVVTDLTVIFSSTISPPNCEWDPRIWHRLEKELYVHTSQQSAWLYVASVNTKELSAKDLLVTDITVGVVSPGRSWERRPCNIWILRSEFSDGTSQVVTEVDVLFGVDAVDPRSGWTLIEASLQLGVPPSVPVARLSVLKGRAKPNPRVSLQFKKDGTFNIVQISDTHMGTGVGVCRDAVDAHGEDLPESEADPLTVAFIENILNVEQPDLVVLTGDQVHHDVPDSQSALFKAVDPIIKRRIPFAAVLGNHDSEGKFALSRTVQMDILQNLPFSLCEPGPENVDGIGNFSVQILAPAPSQFPLATLYFLDSHGQVGGTAGNPDYAPIQQSQIDWFRDTSQAQRSAREKHDNDSDFHLSLAFQHIPLPEFGDEGLSIHGGRRREPTESPRANYSFSFYDALVEERVSALGCGHDHVNDFCGLLPQQTLQGGNDNPEHSVWLCYGGGSGFGGYCSYGKKRFHRRMRVWQLTSTGDLTTWMRVEYGTDRVSKLVLVEGGRVVNHLTNEIKTKAMQ